MPQSEGIRVRLHLLYGRPDIKQQGRHYTHRVSLPLCTTMTHQHALCELLWVQMPSDGRSFWPTR